MIGKKDTVYTISLLPLPDNSIAAIPNTSTPKRNVKPYVRF